MSTTILPTFMTAPTAALSARQLKKVQDLVAPEASQGVLEFQNLCLGGVPLCTYTIGALKSLLLGDGSHLLVIGEMDTADSTLLSSLMTLESATAPTPELMTAIISRILSRIASGEPMFVPPQSLATAPGPVQRPWKSAIKTTRRRSPWEFSTAHLWRLEWFKMVAPMLM